MSKNEWSQVSDDMDMVYDNKGFTSDNVELELAAQETDETVKINQLNINELTRSVSQLSIDRNSENLIQTFLNTVLSQKNQFVEFKIKNENSWHKCQ